MIKAYAKSDIGKAREKNQDRYYITEDAFANMQLFMLADGMGGCNAGEVASSLAIECSKKYIENNINDITKDKDSLIQLIASSVEYANMVIYEKSIENKDFSGMGTTLEICLIYNNRIYMAHIGDSRVFRIRKGMIRQLTQDHSYVEALVKEGNLTKEEAKTHPKKNVLTKALGCNAFVEPDVMVKGFQKEDLLVICSDGLTNMVSLEDILNKTVNNFETAPKELVDLANKNGGIDNITVITIKNL